MWWMQMGFGYVYAFKWGYLAASIAMLIGTLTFFFLKDKYVRTPDGKPIGGLPSKNVDSDYAEGEAQKAVFSTKSLMLAGTGFHCSGAHILLYSWSKRDLLCHLCEWSFPGGPDSFRQFAD